MRKLAIVTDSAADILPATARKLGVRVAPMRINMGGDDLRDGVDVQIGPYLDQLGSLQQLPRTSMPSPTDFMETYRSLAIQGYTDILSIHLSRSLSSTIEIPRFLAGTMFNDVHIEVIDSRTASGSARRGRWSSRQRRLPQQGAVSRGRPRRRSPFEIFIKIQFVPKRLTGTWSREGGSIPVLEAFAAFGTQPALSPS